MKPSFLKILSIFIAVFLIASFLFAPDSFAKSKPKTLKTTQKNIVISVDQVPENTVSLVVFNQSGVGLIQTNGNLPSMFNLTVNFKGLKRGKTDVTTGEVVDKLGGTPIDGAVATTKTKKIKVK